MMRALAVFLALGCLFAADEVAERRQALERELSEKDSPLSLVARRTMGRGTTRIEAGDLAPLRVPPVQVEWDGKTAALVGKTRQTLETRPDNNGIVRVDEGPVTVALHWSGKTGELFARIYDQEAPKKKPFPARVWYPVDARFRIEAEWRPFPEVETYTVSRADGTKADYPSPGQAVFRMDGKTVSLRALRLPDGRLFLPFKDQTAPRETYGAGRFLYAKAPAGGKVILDFNMANNPNCAFSPYWSCVLPPKENVLPVRIPAGEKNWPGL
jgi:uncharacterized protein (DUF1684 family)